MISGFIRKPIQHLANRAGYRFVRIKESFVPEKRRFESGRVSFGYWVNCIDSAAWYQPEEWGSSLEFQQLRDLVEPGDRVLEVGCNTGFTTLTLAGLTTSSGFVLGVDIVPENVIVAQASVYLNGLQHVKILHTGAGDKEGQIGFVNQINGEVSELAAHPSPVTTCDALDAQYGPFNVVKIDVEGYENTVLKGATKLMARRPKLALEIHGELLAKYNSSVGEVLGRLGLEDYEGQILNRSPKHHLVPFAPDQVRKDTYPIVFLRPKSIRS